MTTLDQKISFESIFEGMDYNIHKIKGDSIRLRNDSASHNAASKLRAPTILDCSIKESMARASQTNSTKQTCRAMETTFIPPNHGELS